MLKDKRIGKYRFSNGKIRSSRSVVDALVEDTTICDDYNVLLYRLLLGIWCSENLVDFFECTTLRFDEPITC